jgi:tetratricopeptide (TPR) repeat protein
MFHDSKCERSERSFSSLLVDMMKMIFYIKAFCISLIFENVIKFDLHEQKDYGLPDIVEHMDLTEYGRLKWERSRILKKEGKLQDAERELREALEGEPDHPLLKTSMAHLYLRQDRFREARILAESVLSHAPEYPQALYVLGETYYHEGNHEDALRCFVQAAQMDPIPYLTRSIIRTLKRLKRYEEALETVETALMTDRENVRLLMEKALVLERMRLPAEALRTYERLKELDPEDPFVAKAIYKLKSLDRPEKEVIGELQKVLTIPSRKDNPQLHGLLGEKLKKAGRLKEAAAEYEKAGKLAPENPFFKKQEGFCRYKLKDYTAALRLLGEAFRNDPADYILKSTLHRIYSVTGDLKGFVQLIEEVLEEHPHNVKLMGTLRALKKKVNMKDPNHA